MHKLQCIRACILGQAMPRVLGSQQTNGGSRSEHTYKYFPSQEAWTWEQQPGYTDNRPAVWHGSLNVNGLAHEAWEEGQWEAQARDGTRTRDNGWSGQMNMNRVDAGEQMAGQTMERGPGRQRRLDNFPLTAPAAAHSTTRPTWPHHTASHQQHNETKRPKFANMPIECKQITHSTK